MGYSLRHRKAFLMIGLAPQDQDSTRFLWLHDPTDINSPIVTYRFKVILFGSTCSQFILNAAVKHHLENLSSPIAKDLLPDLYIDNLVSTFRTEQEIEQYYYSTNEIMSGASLHLREWSSNSQSARSLFRQYNNHTDEKQVKVLGMVWNNEHELISYPYRPLNELARTKREVLRTTAAVFDPIGYIAPVVIRAKIFLQKLWRCNLHWDQEFEPKLQLEWRSIAEDITLALSFTLPRQLIFSTNVTIHVFGDASQKAYCAVAYIVSEEQSNLIMVKVKVAPLKTLSIPKLELTAATLSARLLLYVKDAYKKSLNVLEAHLWSDSQTTLQWINSNKIQQTYVQNRIDEIRRLTSGVTWHYVPTADNPSDILSRGTTAKKVLSSELWRHGPEWITRSQDWPRWEVEQDEPDLVSCAINVESSPTSSLDPILDYNRFSYFSKLLKVTMLVHRFIHNLRHPRQRIVSVLNKRSKLVEHNFSLEEKTIAESYWIIFSQRDSFSEEYEILYNKRTTRNPRILSFNLFLDGKFLRCNRRIDHSNLPYDAKYPILLPSKHHITVLLIRDQHLFNHHINVAQLMLFLQQRFHIPRMRQSIKGIVKRCIFCKRLQGVHYPAPPAPPLPVNRVTPSRPFSYVGLDYTGAIYVRDLRKGKRKVYIALFSCFVTRAVHLEVVEDNTKDSFLLALRRFASRRGTPTRVLSDNSTTFTASADYLKSMQALPSVRQYLFNKGIAWKFIASRSPQLGAVYERLTGVVKSCLRKILGNALVTKCELDTVVTEVEQCVNSRPLTHVDDALDLQNVLTPSKLIYGYNIDSLPIPAEYLDLDQTYGTKESVTKRYRYVISLLDSLWKTWSSSYLTSLRQHAVKTGNPNVRVGDVVFIFDDCSRFKWRIGRVTRLRFTTDGYARSADLDTATGPTSRSILKLYPLELNNTSRLNSSHTAALQNPNPPTSSNVRPKRQAAIHA
jgi:hypothetical protein